MAGTRSNATDVRDSIEAKVDKDNDVEMADAPADEDDIADQPEDEIDDEDDDADGDADADDDDADPSNFVQRIDKLQRFLSEYQENGEEIAAGFQRIPNKRVLPDYFTVIDTPIAFSTVRHKLNKKLYTSFAEFVRDVAQICHNAQVYNRPSAGIFKAAERLREVFKEQLAKLVEKNIIKPEEAILPILGDLPPADESPEPGEGDEEEEEDEDEDEDDEEDEEDEVESDEGGRRPSRRGKPIRRHSQADDDEHKKRGRPPKVLFPTESRIDALLKGLRKYKNEDDELLVGPFERLPDKQEFPDYYETIKNPIAIDLIKKKSKRKQYASVDDALADLELMFNNAKTYNEDDSPIFEAAVELQQAARSLATEQKARSDDEFRDENGRLPLVEVQQHGQAYRIGDWVHIKNPNPDNKPIVGQIFRIWQERNGQRWINACWYYHPEQTVHHFEKHFFPHEVFKTGRYMDHPAEDILDRCYVMYITRFFKGRPRGLPSDKSVYVCDTRYNEDQHRFRKIKTWLSCVPEEVRGRDYEMVLFPYPQPQTRVDSPIKHLLRPGAKPTDPMPSPTRGNTKVPAPPLVGAVHCRPRDPKELTPPPTSQPTQPLSGSISYTNPSRPAPFVRQAPTDITMSRSPNTSFNNAMPAPGGAGPVPVPSASPGQYHSQAYQQGQQTFSSASPVAHHQMPAPHHQPPTGRPVQQNSFRQVYPQQTQPPQSYQQLQPQPQQGYQSPAPAQPQYQPQQQVYPQAVPPGGTPHSQHHGVNPASTPNYDPRMSMGNGRTPMAPTPASIPALPRGPQVYHLPDEIENSIPQEIRDRYPKDDQGKMLWFTNPPEDRSANDLAPESQGIGHSMTYTEVVAKLQDNSTDDLEATANQQLRNMTALKKKAYLKRLRQRVEKRAIREKMAQAKTNDAEAEELAAKAVQGLVHWTIEYEKETEAMFKRLGIPYTNTFDNMGIERWTHENAKTIAEDRRKQLCEEFTKVIRGTAKK